MSLSARGGKTSWSLDKKKGDSCSVPHLGRTLRSLGLGALTGIGSWQFALAFPFWITPKAAGSTYIPAQFDYKADLESLFCQSPWTIYTDYALGAVMTLLALGIHKSAPVQKQMWTLYSKPPIVGYSYNRSPELRKLKHLGTTLMICYAVQFTVAGVLHQFYGSLDQRNTLLFRVCWTIVVTMVSASGGVIGAIASELVRYQLRISRVPGDLFWIGYTVLVVGVTFAGLISYQRPAADTFIAGTSQALSTFFVIGAVLFLGGNPLLRLWGGDTPAAGGGGAVAQKAAAAAKHDDDDDDDDDDYGIELGIPDKVRCVLGFLMNSLLLPGYALTLYLTDTPVHVINTVMHSWLCLCYTLQGLSLSKIVKLASAGEAQKQTQWE